MYVGEMDNWAASANRMAARNLLTAVDARTLLPTAATLPEWDRAKASATAFWTEAAGDTCQMGFALLRQQIRAVPDSRPKYRCRVFGAGLRRIGSLITAQFAVINRIACLLLGAVVRTLTFQRCLQPAQGLVPLLPDRFE